MIISPEIERYYSFIHEINRFASVGKMKTCLWKTFGNPKVLIQSFPLLPLITIEENRAIGTLFLAPFCSNGKDLLPALSLAPLAVHPDFQSKGVGSDSESPRDSSRHPYLFSLQHKF